MAHSVVSLRGALSQLETTIARMDGLDIERERKDLLDAHARMTTVVLEFLARTAASDLSVIERLKV